MISKLLNKRSDCVYPFVHYGMLFGIYFHIVSCADFISSRGLQIASGSCCFAVFRKIKIKNIKICLSIHDTFHPLK